MGRELATKGFFSFALHRCLFPHLGEELSGIYVNPDGPACLGREQDRVEWKGGYVIPTGGSMVGRTEIAKVVISSGLAQRRLQKHSRGKDEMSLIVS